MKTRTWFTAQHESDAKTKSWSTTEETSHTSTTSRSRTDGVSVGDEISYELVYDHQVQPETLMALPEDQMLAPHVVEAAASAGEAVTGGKPPAATESKMVALVIDPSVVGTERSPRSARARSRPSSRPPPRSPRRSPTTSASRGRRLCPGATTPRYARRAADRPSGRRLTAPPQVGPRDWLCAARSGADWAAAADS